MFYMLYWSEGIAADDVDSLLEIFEKGMFDTLFNILYVLVIAKLLI